MSHEFESGFFVRKQAWHSLGTVLEDAPTDTREAIMAAGLDWTVETQPVYAERVNADGVERLDCNQHRALVRSSDGSILSIMGDGYTPLQNVDAFKFFEPFLHEGDASLEAAGSLKEGKVVWVLAKMNGGDAEVSKGDKVLPYLLLSNSHNGSSAVRVAFTAIRVVCWNTLSAASSKTKQTAAKIRHTKNVQRNVKSVRNCIDLARQEFGATMEVLGGMRSREIDIPQLTGYVQELFGSPAKLAEIAKAAADGVPLHMQPKVRGQDDIERLFFRGPGASLAGKTAYGAYNAVTHYLDHVRGSSADGRLHSTWFGQGAQVRGDAMKLAETLGS